MHLRTLGELTLEGTGFRRQKPLLLLTYLALEGVKERRFLAELFWVVSPNPRNNLGTAIAQLRKGATGAIGADKTRAWATVTCDAPQLLEALERGAFDRALALYRGAFLEGVDLAHLGVELEEWVFGTREVLADAVRRGLLRLASDAASEGEFAVAARHAERAYRLPGASPPEPRLLEAMHALLAAGDNPRAAQLRSEAQEYGLTFTLTLEGARAELWTAGRADAPPPHNLPRAVTSFVGRDLELVDLAQHLADNDCRLLSLVGTAGVGKTRLALQLARDQLDNHGYEGGIFFVPLDTLTDPRSIAASIAAALDVELSNVDESLAQVAHFIGERRMLIVLDNFEQLLEGAEVASRLVRSCANLTLLITSRARLNVAEEWVYPLEGLRGLPQTGADPREAERGEAVQLFYQRAKNANLRFALTPEVLPDVARICRAVEGLPLGVELAAAWTSVLPVAEIATEIESNLDLFTATTKGVPERHRSLRAAFEHSWRLLTGPEQEALRRLATFRGGFTRGAAAEVAGASIPILASLVGKSLLRVSPTGRFDRHPMLYQFSAEKLARNPLEEQETRRNHASFFLALTRDAEPHLNGVQSETWLARLEEEHDNIRAALDWAVAQGEAEAGLRLAVAVLRFWLVRGHLREGRARLETLLKLPTPPSSNPLRARALSALGTLLPQLGEWPKAQPILEESLTIQRAAEDRQGVADTLNNLGWVLLNLSDFISATTLSREALQAHRRLNAGRGMAVSYTNLGWVAMRRGRFHEAHDLFRESLALRRNYGSSRGVAYGNMNLAWSLRHLGRDDELAALLQEADAINRKLGDEQMLGMSCALLGLRAYDREDDAAAADHLREGIHYFRKTASKMGLKRFLVELAVVLRETGDQTQAHELVEEALRIARQGKDRYYLARGLYVRASLASDEGNLERGLTLCQESLRTYVEIGAHYGVVEALDLLSSLVSGEPDKAITYLAGASALLAELEVPRLPSQRRHFDQTCADAERLLGRRAVAKAWVRGRNRPLSTLVDQALSDSLA